MGHLWTWDIQDIQLETFSDLGHSGHPDRDVCEHGTPRILKQRCLCAWDTLAIQVEMSKRQLKDRSEIQWHEARLVVPETLKSSANTDPPKERRVGLNLIWRLDPLQIWIQAGSKARRTFWTVCINQSSCLMTTKFSVVWRLVDSGEPCLAHSSVCQPLSHLSGVTGATLGALPSQIPC